MKNNNVTALYVRKNSIYKELLTDCYDVIRDARNYVGNNPVICHPPCRAWGNLSHMATPSPGEKELAILAIRQVRTYGGILEHPRRSKLWPDHLPLPGQTDIFGGYTISIDQFWFGHSAKKETFLYIVGCSINDLPVIPLRFDMIEKTIGSCRKSKSVKRKEVTKTEREKTPDQMANWLIEVAEKCKKINTETSKKNY